MGPWTKEINQWLIVRDSLAETWGSAPKTHMAANKHLLTPVLRNLVPSSGLWVLHVTVHRVCMPAKHPNT